MTTSDERNAQRLDRCGNADDEHDRSQDGSRNAQGTVDVGATSGHQSGFSNQQNNPCHILPAAEPSPLGFPMRVLQIARSSILVRRVLAQFLEPPCTDPYDTVVWEGRSRKPSPYPDL
jgi:hypothetical protein